MRDLPFDLSLRGTGLAALALAALAARALGPTDFLLAAAVFAGACVGAALLFYGRHLFDEIELGPRWRRRG